jgi:ribosome-binding factor A
VNQIRLEKINELIKREVGQILQKEFEHSAGQLITITEVETSDDLLNCRIKVTIWPEPESRSIFENLKKATGFLQGFLNKKLKMHPVPKISFELDARVREAGRVEELLEKTNENNELT